jgi:predicted lipoprotein
MGDLDDDMSGPGDMGVLDQEKINEFRTLVRDTRDAWQQATERIEAAFHANYNAPSTAEERLTEAKEAAYQAMDKAWAAYSFGSRQRF